MGEGAPAPDGLEDMGVRCVPVLIRCDIENLPKPPLRLYVHRGNDACLQRWILHAHHIARWYGMEHIEDAAVGALSETSDTIASSLPTVERPSVYRSGESRSSATCRSTCAYSARQSSGSHDHRLLVPIRPDPPSRWVHCHPSTHDHGGSACDGVRVPTRSAVFR